MPTSFLDLLSTPDVQAAQQQALVRQQAQNLSVTPRPALEGVARETRARVAQGFDMDIAARRLRLAEREARAARRQEPFAIGLGALNLGVGVLGRIQDRRLFEAEKVRAERIDALQTQTLNALRQAQDERLRLLQQRRQQLENFLPAAPPAAAAPLPVASPVAPVATPYSLPPLVLAPEPPLMLRPPF